MKSLSTRLATRTAMTLGWGRRGFLGTTRSIHTQTKPLSLPLLRTEKAKWFGACTVPDRDRAIRRTSACVAISVAGASSGNDPQHRLLTEATPVLGDDREDCRIGRGRSRSIYHLEHKARLAAWCLAGRAPLALGGPDRKAAREPGAHDFPKERRPVGVADNKCVRGVATEIEPLGDDVVQAARLHRRRAGEQQECQRHVESQAAWTPSQAKRLQEECQSPGDQLRGRQAPPFDGRASAPIAVTEGRRWQSFLLP